MKTKETTLFKIQILLIAFLTISAVQAQRWRLGGNTNLPAADDITAPGNNFLGSQTGFNTPLKFGVNGSQDIFIDNNPFQLLPASGNNPGVLQGGHWVGLGRAFGASVGPGNNPLLSPKAHLHIHGGGFSAGPGSGGFTAGLRNWMQTGTLYTENSNGMYVGLKSIFNGNTINNQSYAVINWSDDATGGNATTDFLSFNFTSYTGTGLASGADGKELARISPLAGRGTFGIGNFQILFPNTIYSDPVRRLEILDAEPSTGANANAPQLRLTYTYNNNAANGIFSEFQTTNQGDLYFNARANTNLRRFGFHTNTPNNTVEIDALNSSPIPNGVNGTSGLRFTRLTSANTPQANPGTGVLTVNANGDVIYATNNLITVNNGLTNNGGIIQLGAPCSNQPASFQSSLSVSRNIYLNNQDFWWSTNNQETGGLGIGGQPASTPFCNVGNTFEVSANSKNTKYGNTNASGMRFAKLTSASPIVANGVNGVNNTKLLTVDSDGDVVLTNGGGGLACWDLNGNGIGDPGEDINNDNLYNALDCAGPQGPQGPAGPSGGINLAQNGLNLLNSNTVEMGGPLLHHTNVDLNTFDLEFSTTNGNFLVGGSNGFGTGNGQNNIVLGNSNTNNGTGIMISGINNNVNANNVNVVGNTNTLTGAGSNNSFIGGNNNSSFATGVNVILGADNNIPSGNIKNCLLGYANQASNGFAQGQYGMAVGMGVPTYNNALVIGNTTNHNVSTAALNVLNNNFNINALTTKRLFPAMIIDGSNFIGVRKINQNYGSIEVNAIDYGSGGSCGIWASSDPTAANSLAARFDGDVSFNGTLLGSNNILTSDIQFKTNIDTITNPLNIVKSLKPKTFFFDTLNNQNLKFSSKQQYGFIAQDVQAILPELVSNINKPSIIDPQGNQVEASVNYKALNYNAFFALLTGAIQKLEKQVHKQDSIITLQSSLLSALTNSINACCNNNGVRTTGIIGNNINKQEINLSDADVIVLNQNVPNPFAEQTTITYNVPQNYKFAQIVFKTLEGKILRTADINKMGKGEITVYASDLSHGLYTYSLIVDGKLIDTKKMVKE